MQAPMTIKQYVSQMRTIPGGRFTMGRTYEFADPLGIWKDELPAHPVDVSTFRMGATLVTVGMWREYLRANRQLSMPLVPNWDWIDDHPIVNVSWIDIMGVDGKGGYCAWASQKAGIRLSLPTEAQWEYAAKGGKRDLKFPWGNDWHKDKLWCSTESDSDAERTARVVRTNNVYVNPYGLIDMAGNVCQWCFDSDTQYVAQQRDRLGYPLVEANPKNVGSGPPIERLMILRGGSWQYFSQISFRCAYRYCNVAVASIDRYGFRLIAGSS